MTVDLGPLLLDHLDAGWGDYRARLVGLTDAEHLWSPVDGWTVRLVGDRWMIDDVDRDADPAPFTSIAWRMWHIAVDCLDSYSRRAFGSQSGPDDLEWVGTASDAVARSDAAWACFRGGAAELSPDRLAAPLGAAFGGFAERPHAALLLHAGREVIHHGAEVALLRDLYRTQPV